MTSSNGMAFMTQYDIATDAIVSRVNSFGLVEAAFAARLGRVFTRRGNETDSIRENGEFRQRGSTSKTIFDVPALVAYISEFMTLLPGDVISTGTPPGVGLGMKPPQYLKAGDVVELGIDGLGESRQEVVDYR